MKEHIREIEKLIKAIRKQSGEDCRFSYSHVRSGESGSIHITAVSNLLAERLSEELLRGEGQRDPSVPGRLILGGNISVDMDVLASGKGMLQVVTGVANVRRSPSHSSELLTQLIMGESATLLQSLPDWHLIRMSDGYHGWVPAWSVKHKEDRKIREFERDVNAMVSEGIETVWPEPDTESPPADRLVSGTAVIDCGGDGAFSRVEMAHGGEGYIRTGAVEPLRIDRPDRDRLVGRAIRHLGVPYLWGGTTAGGFDCSGLAMRIFRMEGVFLPRDSDLQAGVGGYIPREDLGEALPGDLIFFGGDDSVDHVAIYIGRGDFIHASGEVRTGSLESQGSRYDSGLAGKLLFGRSIIAG